MQTIFIDCGAYKGTVLAKVQKQHPEYACYAFECNPALEHIKYNAITLRKAVWIHDGTMKLYINTKRPTIEGNSLYKSKVTGNLDHEHPVIVSCIDFSFWLKNEFSVDKKYIIVKMNIEGAEYLVLEKCIKDGTIKLIDELHVQWHYMKIPAIGIERHRKLVADLQVAGVRVYNGYGKLKANKK